MSSNGKDPNFPTTAWTLISRIRSRDEKVAARALDEICAQYHYPLYCYIRRRGLDHHDAQDALHDFLAKLLRLETFENAQEEKGRLRSLLAAALSRFLINWHRDHAHPDGEVSTDADMVLTEAEARYLRERFTDADTPALFCPSVTLPPTVTWAKRKGEVEKIRAMMRSTFFIRRRTEEMIWFG